MDKLQKQLRNVNDIIKEYDDGRIALSKPALSDYYDQRREIIKEIKRTCKHDKSQLYVYCETDRGYGTDRNYYYWAARCLDCDEHLCKLRARDCLEASQSSKIMPIIDLIKKHPDKFTGHSIEKLGVKKVIKKRPVPAEYDYVLVR